MGLFDRLFRRPSSVAGAPGPGPAAPPLTDEAAHITAGQQAEDQGRPQEALALFDRAVASAPTSAKAHLNRGNALMKLGDFDAAAQAYGTALQHDPAMAGASYNLGNALARRRRLDDACAAYRQALALRPEFFEAQVALGAALEELGQRGEAAEHYRRALGIRPDHAPVHGNLGAVLLDMGQPAEAAQALRQALRLDPQLTQLHYGLGAALHALGEWDAAAASYRAMVSAHPGFAPAHGMLGNVLTRQGHLQEALSCYESVLALAPGDVLAHNNLALLLDRIGRLDDAIASCRRALQIDPGLLTAQSNLTAFENSRAREPSALLLAGARRFGELAAHQAKPFTHWDNPPDPERPLRVGFVSGDLRAHPVGYFLLNVLDSLGRRTGGRLVLCAYFNGELVDEVSARIQTSCALWRDTQSLDDEAFVRQVRADGIDILIDLSGHTQHNRLPAFAWKPAPVQVTWLGYLGTTGVEAIDYLLADAWTLPAEDEPFFTERIWRLPESYLCFTPPTEEGTVGTLPALARDGVTFGSFNNLSKVNDAVVALWARVLDAVPKSRLLLKAQQLSEAATRQSVAERFARHGIGGDRLLLEPPVPRADYLKPFGRLDIALDPFPYPGITTSVECLWMGVPFVTLAGRTFQARQGMGLLQNAGLADWIASDEEDYVRLAARHAADLQGLQRLRSGLRQRVLASPIFDAQRFAARFEDALRAMWHTWCDTAPRGTAAARGAPKA